MVSTANILDLNDIGDNPEIDFNDIAGLKEPHILISLPRIYVSADKNGIDEGTQNFRSIPESIIPSLWVMCSNIEFSNVDEQTAICKELIKQLTATCKENKNIESIMPYISKIQEIVESAKTFDVDDLYINTNCSSVTFDPIRIFENDEITGLLKNMVPIQVMNNISFYSELLDPSHEMLIRAQCNDTDINRFYYILLEFEKTILFHPTRILNSTSKMINIILFFILLCSHSRPVSDRCANDLIVNLFVYILDLIVRSRLITAWHRYEETRTLLRDFCKNYSKDNLSVMINQYDDEETRANIVLSKIVNLYVSRGGDPNKCSFVKFAEYKQILNEHILIIDNKNYFDFGVNFLTKLLSSNMFTMLNEILNDSKMKVLEDEL